MVQEDIEQKSVVVIMRGTKITARMLAKAMALVLKRMRKANDTPGRQSFKQLAKGGALENIEVTDDSIRAFEPIARKYGVHYKPVKDASCSPPRWMVFFRAKEADQLTAAMSEFAAKTLKREADRPSVREAMAKAKEAIRHAVLDRARHKERSGPEL
jgi:NADH dehydrogenase/NADH:ubiquinone oxidoreductase subunit G